MSDMLVKLYELPSVEAALHAVAQQGVQVRRALPLEKPRMLEWMHMHYAAWAPEVESTFARLPVSCFLALRSQELIGFACYDASCLNFFGPTSVFESERGRGVGRALLLAALHAQKAQGYGYAIIGAVGPEDFYAKAVGAVPIEGSTPGIYAGRLKPRTKG